MLREPGAVDRTGASVCGTMRHDSERRTDVRAERDSVLPESARAVHYGVQR